MKTLTLIALLALCLAAPAFAQSYAYHDDSNPASGSTNTFPFGNSFGNNWRYQFTVPATALPTTPCRFTEVAFGPTASGTFAVKDFQLRMAHTASLTLSSVFTNNFADTPVEMIDVQGGNYTFAATYGQWTPLGATKPFDWDGQRHLIIEIRYRGIGTLNQGSTSIRAYTSATNANRVWANGSYPAPGPADPYATTTGYTPSSSGGIKVRLTYATTVMTLSGNPAPGGTVDLALLSAADAGRPYQVATSFGPGPIKLGQRALGLTPDKLMEVTVNGYLPWIFVKYAGSLDAGGQAKAQIKLPNDSRLKGLRLYSAFVTFAPSTPFGISNISNTEFFAIQ